MILTVILNKIAYSLSLRAIKLNVKLHYIYTNYYNNGKYTIINLFRVWPLSVIDRLQIWRFEECRLPKVDLSGVIVPVRVPSIGQIKLFKNYLY